VEIEPFTVIARVPVESALVVTESQDELEWQQDLALQWLQSPQGQTRLVEEGMLSLTDEVLGERVGYPPMVTAIHALRLACEPWLQEAAASTPRSPHSRGVLLGALEHVRRGAVSYDAGEGGRHRALVPLLEDIPPAPPPMGASQLRSR
jgi:hypothetical protein